MRTVGLPHPLRCLVRTRAQSLLRGSLRSGVRMLAIAACLPPLSVAANAQQASAPAPPVIRTLIGDLALMMRLGEEGTLALGAAGARRTLTLNVRASDARRWADSAARLLAPAPRPRRTRRAPPSDSVPVVQRARAILEEPGVGAGSFVLTRVDSAGARSFLLFIDDAELDALRQPMDVSEATTLVRLVRKAATPPKVVKPKVRKGQARPAPPAKSAGAAKRAGAPKPANAAPTKPRSAPSTPSA